MCNNWDTTPNCGQGEELDSASVGADGRLAINVSMSEAVCEGTNYFCVTTNRIGPGNSTVAALRSRDINVTHS